MRGVSRILLRGKQFKEEIMKKYKIEFYSECCKKWMPLHGFTSMKKLYAYGAWNMLSSHYNQHNKHRLFEGNVVIDECGLKPVRLA